MNLTLILFLIGILGFVLNRKNIILMLISIEIMLLAITFLILISSLNMDDIIGQTYAIYIIVIAGAESAIGLGILVAFYRLNTSLKLYTYLIASRKNIYPNSYRRSFSTNANQSFAAMHSVSVKKIVSCHSARRSCAKPEGLALACA